MRYEVQSICTVPQQEPEANWHVLFTSYLQLIIDGPITGIIAKEQQITSYTDEEERLAYLWLSAQVAVEEEETRDMWQADAKATEKLRKRKAKAAEKQFTGELC